MRLEAGDEAPGFALSDQDGVDFDLASRRGRRVLIYFYPQDDTPGCTREACQFNDALSGFDDAGVEVVGVSADGAESHRRFRAKYGLRFRLLSDPGNRVGALYGAHGEKVQYGRPTVGVIRSSFLVGTDGRIERAWYAVRTDGHATRVLNSI
jgi:peroxiredoxin Q/BCP